MIPVHNFVLTRFYELLDFFQSEIKFFDLICIISSNLSVAFFLHYCFCKQAQSSCARMIWHLKNGCNTARRLFPVGFRWWSFPMNLGARALISKYKTALRSLGSVNIFLQHDFDCDNVEHNFRRCMRTAATPTQLQREPSKFLKNQYLYTIHNTVQFVYKNVILNTSPSEIETVLVKP